MAEGPLVGGDDSHGQHAGGDLLTESLGLKLSRATWGCVSHVPCCVHVSVCNVCLLCAWWGVFLQTPKQGSWGEADLGHKTKVKLR